MTDDAPDPMIARAVASLRDREPARDLWPAIAPRLSPRLPRGTVLVRWPVALAAGLAVAVASAAATYTLLRDRSSRGPVAVLAASSPLLTPAAFSAPADSTLLVAIAEVQRLLAERPGDLDPVARESIARSVALLDQAIADAAAVRARDPDDAWAARYLTATLRRKLDMLQTAVVRSATQS